MKVTIPVRRGSGRGHVQMEELTAPPSATVTIPRVQHKALMAAIQPFVQAADNYADCDDAKYIDNDATLTVGNLRDVRTAFRAVGIQTDDSTV
jgi:hypothetical protein